MKTVLYDEHLKFGGLIVDFAGWSLPVMYSSIIQEHLAVRTSAGLFDISHMGEILIEGKDSIQLLEKLIPTRVSKLETGKSMYTLLCKEDGTIIDDLFIFKMSEEKFYLVVNASRIEIDLEWITKQSNSSTKITNISERTAKLDLQGPNSKKIITTFIDDTRLNELERFYFIETKWKGFNLIISATGYTGESGFELYIENGGATKLWSELLHHGKAWDLIPAGLGARDSLRVEASYSLYGHEISEQISPIEGGLSWLVSSSSNYIGKKALDEEKKNGTKKEIIAFELMEKGIPREKHKVFLKDKEIGIVTSGCFSPTFKKGIGLALVEKNSVELNKTFSILIRNKNICAIRVSRPIYKFKPWNKG